MNPRTTVPEMAGAVQRNAHVMKLGKLEAAVYELLRRNGGRMSPEESALWRAPLKNLVAGQLVRRGEDGGHEVLVRAEYAPGVSHTDTRAEHPSVAPPPIRESMATLTSRVPPSQIEGLDRKAAELGVSRSDALRGILDAALSSSPPEKSGSGTRPRVTPAGGTRARRAV